MCCYILCAHFSFKCCAMSVVTARRVVLLDTTTTWRRRRRCVVAAISTSPTAWHLVGVDDVETLSCTTRLCHMFLFRHTVFAFLCSELGDFCAETCPFCQPLCTTTRRFNPCYMQRSLGYRLYRPSYSRLCHKFRCHGNRGWSQYNLSGVFQ